ncbi:FAD/NAD(P)-binding domain-containing protein [Favolaschia claudopus]|uniref:FAD/NAD(P)-binding domain-containing protein n=1 Tax=Favolaschia claudopus TaxID=2862362 RepID=A0AAW0EHT1_9AGAR
MASSSSSKIVIVGAGSGGGAVLARALSTKLPSAKITLINPLPYAISRPTLPRMTVSDQNDLFDTALMPYDKLFANPNGTFVQGLVEIIKPAAKGGSVVLASGQELPYDILVLAPGSIWEGPLDFPTDPDAVKAFLSESRARFSKAQKIVLAGGGAVGIEYAGEIKDIWPNKEVTIVHGDKLLFNPAYPDGFRKGMEKSLRDRGVSIILNDFLDDIPAPGPANIKTRNGHSIDADLVVTTRGPRPNTEFVARSLGADTLDERGQIKVTKTLQLINHPNIFAIGDAINTVEQKQVMKAMAHSGIVAGNIIATVSGKGLKPYKGSPEMIIVTNGKNGGKAYMGILWGLTFGDWFARMIKSKTLMVPMARSGLGLS